jgi:dsRNA-specific ribonuclease
MSHSSYHSTQSSIGYHVLDPNTLRSEKIRGEFDPVTVTPLNFYTQRTDESVNFPEWFEGKPLEYNGLSPTGEYCSSPSFRSPNSFCRSPENCSSPSLRSGEALKYTSNFVQDVTKKEDNTFMNNDDDIRIERNANGVEIYIFDPYNPLNKLISAENIQNILEKYGVKSKITNYNLYKRAFVHRSYIKRPNIENVKNNVVILNQPEDCLPLYTKSNERLEFVGDGILECITKYYLYRRFPKENEGFMTEKKIALVKNESIGKMAMEMGLHKWFIVSKHAEMKNTRTNLKKLGCLFEAFIGAMFLDFNKIQVKDENNWFRDVFVCGPGFQMVQIFVENVFEKHVDWINLIRNDDNYKNILQVKLQKEFKVTPNYIEIQEHDSDHGYYMGVYLCLGQSIHEIRDVRNALHCENFKSFKEIHDYVSVYDKILLYLGKGVHKIKKKAEQIACDEALNLLKKFHIDPDRATEALSKPKMNFSV